MKNETADTIATLILLTFIGFIFSMIVFSVADRVNQARIERKCLALGYPQGDFRWFGPSYCIKRVDQTDTVIVLDR